MTSTVRLIHGLWTAAIAVLIALAFAACGGGDGGDNCIVLGATGARLASEDDTGAICGEKATAYCRTYDSYSEDDPIPGQPDKKAMAACDKVTAD